MDEEEITEEQLQAGERSRTDHVHDGIEISEEALAAHLSSDHAVDLPDGLSFGALQGLHDRFHGEAHAIDD